MSLSLLQLMMVFHDLCVKQKLPAAEGFEFEGLVDALEAHGLVKIVPSKSKIKQDDQVEKVPAELKTVFAERIVLF